MADQASLRAASGGSSRSYVAVGSRNIAASLTSNYGKQPDSSDTALGPNLVIGLDSQLNGEVEGIGPLNIGSASGGGQPARVALLDTLDYDGFNERTLKTDSTEILRILRKEVGETSFSEWGLGMLNLIRQEEILQSDMFWKSDRGQAETNKSRLDGLASQSEKNLPSWTLRALWVFRKCGCSPQRRKLAEQQFRELGTTLSKLPHERTSQFTFLYSLWTASEGLGILRQALSTLQEVGRSVDPQGQSICHCEERNRIESTKDMRNPELQLEVPCKRLLQQTRDAETPRKTSVIGGQGSAMQVRRLTPL
jgi:hypothetical protein